MIDEELASHLLSENYGNFNPGGDGLITDIALLPGSLQAWRGERGLTLKQLGKRTGLSISFLSDLENGRSQPSLDTLQKLATAYQMTITIDIGYSINR